MTTRLQALARICATADREQLATPYTVEVDGARWTAGSDGHGLLALRELADPPWPAPPVAFDPVIRKHRLDVPGVPIDLVALKEWARVAAPIARAQCNVCNGSGKVPCHECRGRDPECDYCDDGTWECEVCEHGPRWMPGFVGAARLNRAVLWKWLQWVDGPIGATVYIPPEIGRDPKASLYFRGDDWFLLVMPLSTFGEHERYPDTPVFSWPGLAAATARR